MSSNGELIHQNDNVETKVFDSVPDGEVISPIKFVNCASCLTDVRGDEGFEEIEADHVNLQEDISELNLSIWVTKSESLIKFINTKSPILMTME